jgi:hypothetical protein
MAIIASEIQESPRQQERSHPWNVVVFGAKQDDQRREVDDRHRTHAPKKTEGPGVGGPTAGQR